MHCNKLCCIEGVLHLSKGVALKGGATFQTYKKFAPKLQKIRILWHTTPCILAISSNGQLTFNDFPVSAALKGILVESVIS